MDSGIYLNGAGLVISGPVIRPMAIIRIPQMNADLTAALSAAFYLEWPVAPNRCASKKDITALWLSPQEWAVIGLERAKVAELSAGALTSALHHVSSVSDGYVSFQISGRYSRDLIAKGCSLDLHSRAFLSGSCAQSLMAGCFVIIHRSADNDNFDIIVDATFSQYFETWLLDASTNFASLHNHAS